MTRTLRLLLAGVLLVGLTAALGVAQAPPARAADAADRYVACLNGSQTGDVLVLIDTSASLQDSDAEAARVRAGEYLLRRLAKSAEDGQLNLNVSLAGFANRYEPGTEWTQLNAGSVNRVLSDIETYQQRNTGQGTDYWLGLEGARRALTERKQAAPESCQAIVFFSDGALDIDRASDEDENPIDRPYAPGNPLRTPADRERARAAATESLCRAGGLADQIRVVPITVFGVGLAAGEADATDFDLMRRIVEGGCGEEPGNGQFALASDIDSLLQAFDRVTGTGQQQEGGFCQGDQAQLCEEGAHSFVLDASISSVAVLGAGDIEEPRIVLVAPDERQVVLATSPIGEPQSLEIDGMKVDYTWMSKKTFSATLDSAGRNDLWTGRWRLIFFDPQGTNPQARSRTSIHISGNVFPAWPGAETAEVRSGESTEITFGLEDADHRPIDPAALLGDVTLDATLVDADGVETPIATGLGRDQITSPQQLDASSLKPGPASVRLALNVTTASWRDPRTGQEIPGTELKPQLTDIPFTVKAPAGFGTVDPAVSFGSVEGPIELSGALEVTGPGCVWLDNTATTIRTGPAPVTQVAVNSPMNSAQTCLRVADGATETLPLTLTSPQTGSGLLTGTFAVKMASLDAPDRVQDFTVDYSAEILRPLNTTNFILTLIAALVLGPGIPLLLLYLAKWGTAKIPARPLVTEVMPVRVNGSRILRDGAPLALREGDLRNMTTIAGGSARRLDLGGIVLQTRAGRSPFGVGEVRVEAGNQVGASSTHSEPVGKRHQARLPLAVHNEWVLLHDPNGPADAATAVLLVEGDASSQRRQELVEDLNRRGPQVFSNLRALNTAPPAGPAGGQPVNPFGPGGPPMPGAGGPPMPGGGGPPAPPFGGGPGVSSGPSGNPSGNPFGPPRQGGPFGPPPTPPPPPGQNPFG